MANKENIQKNEVVGNRREIKENHRRSEGGRRVVRRHTSHKKEWRESFVTKRDSLEGDSSMLWTGNFERYQSYRKDKRRMSLKESMMVPECLASPGVHSDSGISSGTLSVIRGSQTFGADTWMTSLDDSMEGKNIQSSNRTFRSEGTSSKVYTNQERENKNTLRTPDNTPPRPDSLPYCHELPQRQLVFGPIGSHLKSSLAVSAAYSPLQKIPHDLLKPVGSPLQIGTLSDTSKFYQNPSLPQPTPKSASYRPPNPSANLASLDLSLSPLLAPGVVHFPNKTNSWR